MAVARYGFGASSPLDLQTMPWRSASVSLAKAMSKSSRIATSEAMA